jgi:hypothetical protein
MGKILGSIVHQSLPEAKILPVVRLTRRITGRWGTAMLASITWNKVVCHGRRARGCRMGG